MKKLALILAALMLGATVITSCNSGAGDDVQKNYSAGTFNENGYTSEWLGLSFVPDKSVVMATETELHELMQISADSSAFYVDEATGEKVLDRSKITSAYEMMATDSQTGSTVFVMAEAVSDDMTVEQYIEALKTQLSTQVEGLIFDEPKTKKLGGEKYTCFGYGIEAYGVTLAQSMYLRREGDRIACICFTYSEDSEMEAFLGCFAKYGK